MNHTLKDKVIVITGASSGIGEASARLVGAEQAKVAVVARRKDRLDKLAEEITQAGGQALAIEADVADKNTCQAIVKQVIDKWGRLDVLVNNAGVMLLGPVIGAPLEEWEQMVQVNVMGLLYLTHAALPVMKQQKSGHIVNISSVAGRTTRSGSAVYNATKWGVCAFTDALRQELAEGKTGIRTTLIEPGAVATELISHNRPDIQEQLNQRFTGIAKLTSEDIAAGIAYAISQPEHVSVNEVLIRPSGQVG
ncbi:MAG: SDR family oxidoreductase [Patescibacteria group bacterium]|nr:SDR family oxidoreductase [Patescibacteria group bacterium]